MDPFCFFVLNLFLLWCLFIWIRRSWLMLKTTRIYPPLLPHSLKIGYPPKVSIILPCRNEEKNLPRVLPSLLSQDYPDFEVIVVDDRSEDKTLSLLKEYQQQYPNILKIIQGKPLPAGWTGKNHALFHATQEARGEWFLFTDADTFHHRQSLSSSLSYALSKRLNLLTLSGQCECGSFGEHLIQPMAIGCFSVWFRMDRVNQPDSAIPLCNGQYLLMEKTAYEETGGNEKVKGEVTEDLALFREFKRRNLKVEIGFGPLLFSTRMYHSFNESWNGWRRIFLHALDKDILSLCRKIGMLFFYSTFPFVILLISLFSCVMGVTSYAFPLLLSLAVCSLIIYLRLRSHNILMTAGWPAFLHPLSSLLIAGILIDSLIHHLTGKKVVWKSQAY